MSVHRTRRLSVGYLALAVLALAVSVSQAASQERDALRVCSDPNNLPFSNSELEGFENKIAALFGHDLGIPVEYTWFPQRRGFERHTLRDIDPVTGRAKCDLIMGVPKEFELGLTTRPYYRSTWALVYRPGQLGQLDSADDFLELPAEQLHSLRIGVFDATPGTVWLRLNGLVRQMVGYPTLNADPNEYPGKVIERDLAQSRLDVAIVWGPIAGYFVKRDENQDLALLPLESKPGLRFDFAIAMAVRYGEGDWKQQVQELIDRNADEIEAILQDYNVPLLPLRPSDLKPPEDDD